MNKMLECKCKTCGKKFFTYYDDVVENENSRMELHCPFNGRHKDIHIINRFENIKELMEQKCGVNC